MRPKLNVMYRNAAEEFARRVITLLEDQVHAIMLYGSAARKKAKRDSDIDVFVVGSKNRDQRKKVLDIAYDVTEGSDFEAFIAVMYFSQEEVRELVRLGSPFIANVLQEGVVLHDDGTVTSLRARIPASR